MDKKVKERLLGIFPVDMRKILTQVSWQEETLEEIRVRVGQPMIFVYGEPGAVFEQGASLSDGKMPCPMDRDGSSRCVRC